MLCQQRSLADSVDERPVLPNRPAEPRAISISIGIGAAAFATRPRLTGNIVSDGGPNVLPDFEAEDERVAGAPALSASLVLQQPLLELRDLRLHLEQHFSLLALRALVGDEGDVGAGLAEFLAGVRAPDSPLSFAAGVTTGVALVEAAVEFSERQYVLMLGAAAVVRYELDDLPGGSGAAFSVIARIGTLFPEGSYSDGQLAFSLGL